MEYRQGRFNADDLVRIVRINPVVISSGGPVMEGELEDGDKVLCTWDTWEDGSRKYHRRWFAKAMLRSLVPYQHQELSE